VSARAWTRWRRDVYWIPTFELLDARGFVVFLVNARDAKHVPGRNTDINDPQWLQRLHAFDLLRASFRPKGQIAELRAYLRQRERLLEYGVSHIQHMQRALTDMNVQLTDITGSIGLRIIRAILAGDRNPAVLARMRDRVATRVSRRLRKRSPVATALSTCSPSNRPSLSTTRTNRRHLPARLGSRPC